MRKTDASISTESHYPLSISADNSFPNNEEKEAMNDLIDRLGAGAEIVVYHSDENVEKRRLTVEEHIEEWDATPDWTTRCLGEHQIGVILSGYGTEYLLIGLHDHKRMRCPQLTWPSTNWGEVVRGLEVETPGEQLASEKTAGDLLWRVSRYDGR